MKKYISNKALALSIITMTIMACKTDREEADLHNSGLKEQYSISRFSVLDIDPKVAGQLTWSINDSVISTENILEFISAEEGVYPLKLTSISNGNTTVYTSKIVVTKEQNVLSKYISNVFDYQPAVGQFINEMPQYASGNSSQEMIQNAKESLVGSQTTMISLGGYGGFVTFGFDHTIPNLNGRDFKILGNAFWDHALEAERVGSIEPGIIMVAYDSNKNGKPDDNEWYEIAGSEYFKNTTIKNYEIIYHKPNETKIPVTGDSPWQTDVEYIKWEDSMGNYGFKTKNTFHTQSYYPSWYTNNLIKFKGTKLAVNYYDQSGTGDYWVGESLDFGYADNAPNNDEGSNIDISWAVDKNGNYVKLPGINFIKVYTAINQEAGWLGEVSTEVSGAYNLHFK